MLTMSIPDVDMSTVCLFRSQNVFNLFARWHQRLWFKNHGVWALRIGI